MKSAIVKWTLITAGWVLFALFFSSESIVRGAYSGRPTMIAATLVAWGLCASVWLLLTPLVLALIRRVPFERRRWPIVLLLYLAADTVISLFHLLGYLVIAMALGLYPPSQSFGVAFEQLFLSDFHADLLTFWIIVGISHALDYYSRYRERELRASQLERLLAQAQLDSLKMQLQPHFLFNTLNSIAVLMKEDIDAAEHMLLGLSRLLRLSLENNGTNEVTLKEELDFLSSYLEIEQIRFQDRLRVEIAVDPLAMDARVPNLILQPLVENAIRHGIAPRAAPGLIEVTAQRTNGLVELQIRDDGPGPRGKLSEGIGLANTRARLQQLYGAAHRFDTGEAVGGGFVVNISFPFHKPGELNDD